MIGLESILLPAVIPVLADGLRGLFARFTGGSGARPQNVTEHIQLMQAQTDRVKALAGIDALSPSASPWVANLRGSFRYVAVGSIIATTLIAVLIDVDQPAVIVLLELSGASMSFIIGERMYLGLKK